MSLRAEPCDLPAGKAGAWQSTSIATIIVLFIIDRLLKDSVSPHSWTGSFGLFSIALERALHYRPLSTIMVMLMIIVWIWLVVMTWRAWKNQSRVLGAWLVTLLGSASNAWDIMLHRAIVNVITTRSIFGSLAFNLADIMIIMGIAWMLWPARLDDQAYL